MRPNYGCSLKTVLTEDLFQREILSVSELTARLKDLLESEFGLIWLSGEISNLRRPASGHFYMTLKDRESQMRGVMFRTRQRYLDFEPDDGQEVLVRGRLTVYEPRGEYQLVIDYMEPLGEGALRLAFEKLKTRLAEEGLFDEARKKRPPLLPQRVALVTSPTGAAVRDFVRVARRRFENVGLSIYPVRVQGEGAAVEIAEAVEDLNRWGGFDLIVLTRGGGSLEDLWAFNEEVVARAVAASDIPVVSAVGHEVDFTICDFAADFRAPTPSAAAEMVFREKRELEDHLRRTRQRMAVRIQGRVELARERLSHLQTKLGDPRLAISNRRMYVDDLSEKMIAQIHGSLDQKKRELQSARSRLAPYNPKLRISANRTRQTMLNRDLARAGKRRLDRSREQLSHLAARLGNLSPLTVLERGFALARHPQDLKTLRSSDEVSPGQHLNLVLAKGELDVVVDEVIK